jgi:hypothetical protein
VAGEQAERKREESFHWGSLVRGRIVHRRATMNFPS